MSAVFLELHVPSESLAHRMPLARLFSAMEEGDFDAIHALDEAGLLRDPEHHLDTPVKMRTRAEETEVRFDTFHTFDVLQFCRLLTELGVEEFELSAYDDKKGTTRIFADGAPVKRYSDREWRWLGPPDEE